MHNITTNYNYSTTTIYYNHTHLINYA